MSASSSPSLSPEIKHVGDSAESTLQEGFFSPLIQSHTNLMNPICVDSLSCSISRLCFIATPPSIPLNCSNAHCCHCCGQFLQHHTSTALQDVKAQLISVAQMPPQQLGKPEVMENILNQLKDHLCDLMMDQHCVLSILAIFQASTVHHITRILDLVIQNQHKLKEVCMHNHGYLCSIDSSTVTISYYINSNLNVLNLNSYYRSLVIQKLLEHLKTPEQISAAVFAVKKITVRLTKSINGGHVLHHCFKLFSPALTTVNHLHASS